MHMVGQTAPLSSNDLQEILPKPIDSQVLQDVEAVSHEHAPRLYGSYHVQYQYCSSTGPHLACHECKAPRLGVCHAADCMLKGHVSSLPGTLSSTPAYFTHRA